MLEQILRIIKNYFIHEVWSGTFYIENGSLAGVNFLLPGQYYRITGSVFNDGVYEYPSENLKDEVFTGEVWALAISVDIINLLHDIEEWQEKYGALDSPAMSPFNSESFGGYSYSKSTGDGSSSSADGTWQSVFASRLNQWRKIRYESTIRRHDYVRSS